MISALEAIKPYTTGSREVKRLRVALRYIDTDEISLCRIAHARTPYVTRNVVVEELKQSLASLIPHPSPDGKKTAINR